MDPKATITDGDWYRGTPPKSSSPIRPATLHGEFTPAGQPTHRRTRPTPGSAAATPVSRASLQADLANAEARTTRLTARVQQLERRLSESLGKRVWQESGLGAPADVDAVQRTITCLEQQTVCLRASLEEREADLEAARDPNRHLTRSLNQRE